VAGPLTSRRVHSTAAALAAVLCTAALAAFVPARVGAGAVTATLQHARQCASVRAADSTKIVIPVVVDTGGASGSAAVACVPVAAGSNGAQVLAVRAKMLGVPAPRYNESGLLCAIDGYPATGCGQAVGDHYAYWAYYHGGSSWTYANVGPAEWQVFSGDVEGWRFQPDGSATPADPPPRAPSDASTLCPSSVTTTTTTTVASGAPTTTAAPTTPVSTTPPGRDGGAGHGATAPAVSPAGDSASGRAVAPTTAPAATPATSTTPSSVTDNGDHSAPVVASVRTARRVALKAGGQGGDGTVGVIVAVAVIALLGGGAWIRTRRATKAG
jgi:hypothetical protein